MFKKLLVVALTVLALPAFALAQTGTIAGKVVDAGTGESIIGANVVVVGLNIGGQTDIEGNYEIRNVPAGNQTVRVTYIGYETLTRQVTVTAGQTVTVNLNIQSSAIGLDDLVVSGYSIIPKRELTGAVSSVRAREIENVPLQNTESFLQGRAAGVNVTTTSGNPGGAFRVQIRGNGSVNAPSQPLYIVDGVQISFSQQSSLTPTSPLNSINPADIESIEVLKDAASSAIYGAQGAAGVVIITTKRGQQGRTQITARAETGIRSASKNVTNLNTNEYVDYLAEALFNGNYAVGATDLPGYRNFVVGYLRDTWGAGTLNADGSLMDYNWFDFIYDTGVVQKYSVSATGGDAQTQFFISAGYEDTEGHVFDDRFRRLSLRTNFDHTVSERFRTSLNLNLAQNYQFGVCQDGNFINCPPSQAMFSVPFEYPYLADGSYNLGTSLGRNNPAIVKNEVSRDVYVYSANAVSQNTFRISDRVILSGRVGLDYRRTDDRRFDSPVTQVTVNGRKTEIFREVINFSTNLVANTNHSFNGVHNLFTTTGIEYRRDFSQATSAAGTGFPGTFFTAMNAAANPETVGGTYGEYRIGSYFTQIRYNYNRKYFLDIVARYDGHSRFGQDKRWGLFPSVKGAWTISEEDFFNFDNIDELKLRAGFGTAGNAAVGNFAARGLYGVAGSYNGVTALAPQQLANVNLGWEEAQEINLGLDFTMYAGRVTGSFDVFRKNNKELLFSRQLPTDSGFGSITENIGEVKNEGIEFEINTVNVDRGGFVWQTRLNFGLLQNEIVSLPNGNSINPTSLNAGLHEGRPLGVLFVPRWAGVNPADGRPMWYDADGDITYTPNLVTDSEFYKDGVANFTGGFGTTASYKGLVLDAFFQFSFGQWAFPSADYYFTRTWDGSQSGLHPMVLDRWRQPGDITYFPRAYWSSADFVGTSNFRTTVGSNAIYNTAYIRLKNLSLGYDLPVAVTQRLGLGGVKFFVSGVNLMTWTAWPFYDPEVAGSETDVLGNVTTASYPTAMQINGGIEIRF